MSRKKRKITRREPGHQIPAGSKFRDGNKWITTGICLFLAAAGWIVFGQTLGHGFCDYDDMNYIVEQPMVAKGLNWNSVAWAFTQVHLHNWHPLTTLSNMIDCQIYGLNARGHHLTNVALHILTIIACFFALRSLTGAFWECAFVAAIFAVHPLRVESVAWIAERKDVLSGLFFMLTLWAYSRYARSRRGAWNYAAALLFFMLGLMSKPSVVTLPFVLLLLDYWPLKRFKIANGESARKLVLEKIPFLLLTVASVVVTILAQGKAIQPQDVFPIWSRIGNAFVSYAVYIGQMFAPIRLAVFYPHQQGHLDLLQVILAVLLIAGLSFGAVLCRKRYPYAFVGWFWFTGMLVPMIGIMQAGVQAHADRYTYLPQIGLYILLVWAAAEFCVGRPGLRTTVAGIGGAVVVALAMLAHAQTAIWRDNEILWRHALKVTKDNFLAFKSLGDVLRRTGQFEEALGYFKKAAELKPVFTEAHAALGLTLLDLNRYEEAIAPLMTAIALKPDVCETQNNLGGVFYKMGRFDEAMAHYQEALALKPDSSQAHNNVANVLWRKGRIEDAIAHYRRALELDPKEGQIRFNLASALIERGDVDEAIVEYQKDIGLRPSNRDSYGGLASAFLGRGKMDEAINTLRKFLEINPNSPEVLTMLGDILVQKGQFEEGEALFKKALELNPENPAAHLGIGNMLLAEGQDAEAAQHLDVALKGDPTNPTLLNNYAYLLAGSEDLKLRDGKKAVELAERVNGLAGGADPGVLRILAMAYAEDKRTKEALDTASTALELAQKTGHTELCTVIEKDIALYRANALQP